jgi:hypothetical protein
MQVFVLMFNARTENEGIHTLKVGDRNVILMFESEDDATRFGVMLEAQDFAVPSVEPFEAEEIEEFCREAGYECKLVTEGMLAVPPEQNVEATDWQADDPSASRSGSQANRPDADDRDLSDSELDRIRRQLEGLL